MKRMVSLATTTPPESRHLLHLYTTDDKLAQVVGDYLADGAQDGDALIVIATAPHEALLQAHLQRLGIDVASLVEDGALVWLNADDALAALMVDGRPDLRRFDAVIVPHLKRAAARGGTVRAFGEMVDLLWRDGRKAAALELESLWERRQERLPFILLCAYRMGPLDGAHVIDGIVDVCGAHGERLHDDEAAALEHAFFAALDEVLGREHARLLRPLVDAVVAPSDGLSRSERYLHWMRRNLPEHAEAVVRAARRVQNGGISA